MKQRLGFGFHLPCLAAAMLAVVLASVPVSAQEMPAPRKMPRTPVNSELLPGSKAAEVIKSRDVLGSATIIDGDHLRINDVDLRLFGIVPPQLSASFGPQARAALDTLTRGQNVNCHVRDRDHDGRFLATCATENTKADLALELLKRGLAVTARGTLQPTELAASYETAEDAAQAQKLGLWSTSVPAVASPLAPPVAAKTENSNVPPLPSELKKEEKAAVVVPPPSPVATTVAASANPWPPTAANDQADDDSDTPGFFARYQLFITALVVLATALGIVFALMAERRRDRRDEMKAIAAALRGELLAARAVCQARLKTWTEADHKNAAWPRIRSTLYQAYVGRLGWLGAVLARQIASIYGQASDYAAYFNPNGSPGEPLRSEAVSKRQALQTLVQHIEEVLPKLAAVEQTGTRPRGGPSLPSPPGGGIYISAPESSVTYAAGETTPYEMPGYTAAPSSTTPNTTSMVSPAAPLWGIVRKFTQGRRADRRQPAEESLPDYTTLIEEEMARMSSEEESSVQQRNVTKMRSGA